ncbi:MAG TPA: VOC family protein [Polyangia bacterium]|nr:VOC family protein [Polyangia bacterium]
MEARFHLSLPVSDLPATRAFYGGVLGCREGTVQPQAVDFSFFGHQLTCHLAPALVRPAEADTLDGNHFGAILAPDHFHRLAARLREAGARFIIQPQSQRQGTPGERWKMIVADPSGNAVELKCYLDEAQIFAPG